jgi:hypothetical protein
MAKIRPAGEEWRSTKTNGYRIESNGDLLNRAVTLYWRRRAERVAEQQTETVVPLP